MMRMTYRCWLVWIGMGAVLAGCSPYMDSLTDEQKAIVAEHRQAVADLVANTAERGYDSPGPAERRMGQFRTLLRERLDERSCQLEFQDFGSNRRSVQISGSGCGVSLDRDGHYAAFEAGGGLPGLGNFKADLRFRYATSDRAFLDSVPVRSVSLSMDMQGTAGTPREPGGITGWLSGTVETARGDRVRWRRRSTLSGGIDYTHAEIQSGMYVQIYEFPDFTLEGRLEYINGDAYYRLNSRRTSREAFLQILSDDPGVL